MQSRLRVEVSGLAHSQGSPVVVSGKRVEGGFQGRLQKCIFSSVTGCQGENCNVNNRRFCRVYRALNRERDPTRYISEWCQPARYITPPVEVKLDEQSD